jgi:protein-ribulosamine 3-kinase
MIEHILKDKLNCGKIRPARGGGRCRFYDTDRGNFFVKIAKASELSMLEAELKGLKLIEETETVRVPHPFLSGKTGAASYLVAEALDLRPHTPSSQQELGRQLARLHSTEGPEKFGLDFDNTIGLTPQVNTWTSSWVEFFKTNRLEFQLGMIKEKYDDADLLEKGEKLLDRLPEYFRGLEIKPSLLHGDLWGGNTASLRCGRPVVFDPACYWGHHEADLAMMEMFGGFTSDFFDAYHEAIPKSPGFDGRNKLYQLYHYLNHYLLFGGSYRRSCLSLLD